MIVHGRLILDPASPPTPGWLVIEGDRIAEVHEGEPPERADVGGPHVLISPGFIDAHLHLPQFEVVGCDGLTLLEWLDRVVYPAEAKWANKELLRAQVARAYARLLRAGTLGFAGYLTSHRHSVEETIRVAQRFPLRALAGQVLMDRNAPAELLDEEEARLARSTRGRFDASLNPRFAIACTDDLLARTGQRFRAGFPYSLKERDEGEMGLHLFLQTHLAETREEVERVHMLFPDDEHAAAVLDRHGLLSERTLLAHGVHLSDEEWSLIAERGSVIVHCPTANTFLRSGLFNLNAAREHGVRLGLGSDIAAGPDVAMPRVARAMIEVAKIRKMTIAPAAHVPTPAEAWQLITRGNADALGWHDAGRLEPGASADLLALRPPFEIDDHVIGRLIYSWDDAMIESRILAGRIVRQEKRA